ncbi:MAG TPA: hypothetical protein VKE69_11500 [Planctomycetota bacterium]|nr:hypothetical protein [Planctomycetota bacterium]
MTGPTRRKGSLATALAICAIVAAPGLVLRVFALHSAPPLGAGAFGLTIVAAAFVLTWASEAAQMDVPRAFAVVVLSLIAVLPEYAVDVVFAWQAGQHPDEPHRADFAVANMTGANRLLIGIAWPLIWLLHARRNRLPKLRTPRELSLEVAFVLISGLTVSAMALTGHLTMAFGGALAAIFAFYAFLSIRSAHEEPHAVGPAASIMALPKAPRILTVLFLLSAAAYAIYLVAHPFAEALVESGRSLGIDEFILVQWVAPFASEAPEVVVAVLLVQAGRSTESIAVLVSSKVNQFTLLVGCIPFAYALARGGNHPLPLSEHTIAEIVVTGCQTLFAASIIANRTFGRRGAVLLFGLFIAQFVVAEILQLTAARDGVEQAHRETLGRWAFAAIYFVGGAAVLLRQRKSVARSASAAWDRVRGAFRRAAPAHP